MARMGMTRIGMAGSAAAAAVCVAFWPAAAQAPDTTPADILGAAPGCHSAPSETPKPGSDAPPSHAPGIARGLGEAGYAVERVKGGAEGEAGRYFADGLRLTHAFNAPEAVRAFQWSRTLDPDCAMCAWGEAFARGPTINYPVEGADAAKARAAAEDAGRLALKVDLSPKAQGLIAAQRARWRSGFGGTRSDADAYARAMEALAVRFPDDDAIAVEAADALMIASEKAPGWKAAATDPASAPGRARTLIERVIARSPDFAPALHFQIHLMEGAGLPKLAEASADRLGRLAPGAGHLVHMPSHIYYRLGRYEDAAVVNARASAADARYVAELAPPGGLKDFALHSHNVSFGLGGALMSGDAAGALAFAHTAQATFKPGGGVHARSYMAYAHFLAPREVLALPRPDAPLDAVMWRYARGEAQARLGDAAGVEAEAQALAALQHAPGFTAPDYARPYVEIARQALLGRAAMLRGRWPEAIAALSRAADARDKADAWPDPPIWGFPPRRTLAAARLLSGDPVGAERELGRALAFEPNDPVALYVLGEAQARRGERDSAANRAAAQRLWRGDRAALKLELA